jgi:transposase InsO family protein
MGVELPLNSYQGDRQYTRALRLSTCSVLLRREGWKDNHKRVYRRYRPKCNKAAQLRQSKVDNGSEFISKTLGKWACEQGGELNFSHPGRPSDHAKAESYNGRLREECLNAHWFLSLQDAKHKIET